MQRQYGEKGYSAITDLRIWECGGNNYEKRLPRNKITNRQLKLWFFSPRDRWGDPTRKLQLSTPSFQFLLTIAFSFSELMGGVWCNQNTSWFESNKKKVQKGDMVLRTKGNWLNVKSSVTAELGVYIVDFVMVTIPGDKRSGASFLAGEPIRHGSVSPWKPSSWIWPGWCPAVKHVTWLTATGFSSFYDKRKTDDNEEEDLFLFVNIYSFIYFIWGRLLSVIGQAQR